MRTRTAPPPGHGWAAITRCAEIAAASASLARAKTANYVQPVIAAKMQIDDDEIEDTLGRDPEAGLRTRRHFHVHARVPEGVS